MGLKARPIPRKKRLPQARARCDNCLGAPFALLSLVKAMQLCRLEQRRAKGTCHYVVDQDSRFKPQLLLKPCLIDTPWQVGDGGLAIDHRPSHAEAGIRHSQLGLSEKGACERS